MEGQKMAVKALKMKVECKRLSDEDHGNEYMIDSDLEDSKNEFVMGPNQYDSNWSHEIRQIDEL